jgi:ABC-type branched-subunit amino acid transport system substrate-binding protein
MTVGAGRAADSWRIAVTGPFTGPGALLGREMANAAQLAIEDAQASGPPAGSVMSPRWSV